MNDSELLEKGRRIRQASDERPNIIAWLVIAAHIALIIFIIIMDNP